MSSDPHIKTGFSSAAATQAAAPRVFVGTQTIEAFKRFVEGVKKEQCRPCAEWEGMSTVLAMTRDLLGEENRGSELYLGQVRRKDGGYALKPVTVKSLYQEAAGQAGPLEGKGWVILKEPRIVREMEDIGAALKKNDVLPRGSLVEVMNYAVLTADYIVRSMRHYDSSVLAKRGMQIYPLFTLAGRSSVRKTIPVSYAVPSSAELMLMRKG
jgi:hypothetical protein